MPRKKVIVLGSTGSIGKSTLDVMRGLPNRFAIVALTSFSHEEELLKQAAEFQVNHLALSGKDPSDPAIRYAGNEGLLELIRQTDAEMVVNGIAGAAGLLPSIAALESGKHLALANKETLVMSGNLITDLAQKNQRLIIPVDSEHSALFFLLKNFGKQEIEELILTASGGAFRTLSFDQLKEVTWKDALAHPTWKMGRKITIDSATMANKGLEIIEAGVLFSMPVEKIKVTIHPQSCVHSLVRTVEGILYAQVSSPDMRLPIQSALLFPEIAACQFGRLELNNLSLTFEEPEMRRYRCMELARRAAEKGGEYPAVFNAANEVAVQAFIDERIRFIDIPTVIESCLEGDWGNLLVSFEHVLETDRRARQKSESLVHALHTP